MKIKRLQYQFKNCVMLISALVLLMASYALQAQDKSFSNISTHEDKFNKTELNQLEKKILPEFKDFQPKIMDAQKFDNLIIVHLSVKAADHNDAYAIVTPQNQVIDIDNYAILSNIDIKKNPEYSKLAEKFPNISIWPGNHDYPTFQILADCARQLQFNYRLLNGCHACAIGGIAIVGFNFDTKGNFLGTTLIRLSAPPVVSE